MHPLFNLCLFDKPAEASSALSLFLLIKRMVGVCLATSLMGCQTMPAPLLKKAESVNLERANSYSRDGLYREAIEAYEQLLLTSPHNNLTHRNLGIVLIQIGLYKRAETHLLRAVKAFPQNYQSHYYFAEVKRVLKQWELSIPHYEAALSIKQGDMRAARGLAWSYFNLGQYHRSLTLLQQLTPKEQNDPQIMIIRARVHLQLKNHGAALAILQSQKWREHPFYTPYRQSLLGDIYYKRQKWRRATYHYDKALALRPHLSSALVGKAKVYYQGGEFKLSADLFSRSLRVKGDLPEPYLYLARIFQHSHPQKSLEYFKKYSEVVHKKSAGSTTLDQVQANISHLEHLLYSSNRQKAQRKR